MHVYWYLKMATIRGLRVVDVGVQRQLDKCFGLAPDPELFPTLPDEFHQMNRATGISAGPRLFSLSLSHSISPSLPLFLPSFLHSQETGPEPHVQNSPPIPTGAP